MTLQVILTVLLSLPGTDLPASPERAEVVSRAIHDASNGDRRLAALLIAQGYRESRFLDRIQAGRCKPWECDSFRYRGQVRFRSRSYFQLQRRSAASSEEWRSTTGLEAENITAAVRVSARLLSRGLRACGTPEGAIAVYARGQGCRWTGAAKRAALARKIESQLR